MIYGPLVREPLPEREEELPHHEYNDCIFILIDRDAHIACIAAAPCGWCQLYRLVEYEMIAGNQLLNQCICFRTASA
jgi:hypothetical protein